MKKLLAFVLVACMILALGATAFADDNLVGVAMPTKDLQRWNQDGENMKAQLEAAGYQVDLQYGANDIATQVSQIENMIANGCKVLVIASIDGDSLGTVLAQAKEAGIPVIAYDRLIMNSASSSRRLSTSRMRPAPSTWSSSPATPATTTSTSSLTAP